MDYQFVTSATAGELLGLYDAVLRELRERSIVRSGNNPVADYAELLASHALDFQLLSKSNTGFDGESAGVRYEVKARRLSPENSSVRLSALRDLEKAHFHFLVGVIFDPNFDVAYAAKIPHAVVLEKSKYGSHARASIFRLRRDVFDDPRVEDVTQKLRAAAHGVLGRPATV